MDDRKLALREERILKLAMEMPGAFSQNAPYGMTARVRRTLGITGSSQKGLPGMVGTVGAGKGAGTTSGVPKGMGNSAPSSAPTTMSGKMGSAIPKPPTMTPLGGFPTVKPDMQISTRPMPAKPESIRLATVMKKVGWVSAALRAAGGLGSRMVRSKGFWGAAAAGGTAYGATRLIKGVTNMAQSHRDKIQAVSPPDTQPQ